MEGDNFQLIYFYGTHCPACKITRPIINRVIQKHIVVEVNIEEQPVVASNYEIMSIPTLLVRKDEETIHAFVGTRIRKIEEIWNELMLL